MATLKPRPEFAASDEDIAKITRRIDHADSVVIICGGGCHGAADLLRTLSDRLKAPLIHSVKGKDIMPYDDPRWMGGIGMIGTRAVYNAIMGCDLLQMVGADYPYSNFLPSKGTVIQIDERPQVLGRRAPTVLGVTSSARPTLKLLLDEVASKTNTHFRDRVTEERQKWDEMLDEQANIARSADRIHPQAVARAVSDLAKPDAIFVFDTGMGLPPFREGIEFPNPDFAALASACGGHGFTAQQPGELKAALAEAFAIVGPAIVDAVVAANELPNLPHIDLDMIGHFAVAKIKEAVLAVTGR
ncbi:MAG: thiamine pyrophosphate-dependent enzyme [Methylocella sp.]